MKKRREANERIPTKGATFRAQMDAELRSGRFKVGDRFPTEIDLAKDYGLSRPTVREALLQLEREGFLVRRRGAGTVVVATEPARKGVSLAAVVPCIRDREGVYAAIVRGMEDVINDQGHSFVLCNHDQRLEKATAYIERLVATHAAGVLLSPLEVPEYRETNRVLVEMMQKASMPFVLVDKSLSSDDFARFSFVGTNSFSSMQVMVRHLVSVGHRRMAFFGDGPIHTCRERRRGFEEEVRANGLELRAEWILPFSFDADHGTPAVRELLKKTDRPSVIVCVNDGSAEMVYGIARELGLIIPRDLAVVGFDDLPMAEALNPPLTTMRQPLVDVGRMAVEVLLEKIHRKMIGERQHSLPCELVVRKSCGVGRPIPVAMA